jgi:hypothetical protein
VFNGFSCHMRATNSYSKAAWELVALEKPFEVLTLL